MVAASLPLLGPRWVLSISTGSILLLRPWRLLLIRPLLGSLLDDCLLVQSLMNTAALLLAAAAVVQPLRLNDTLWVLVDMGVDLPLILKLHLVLYLVPPLLVGLGPWSSEALVAATTISQVRLVNDTWYACCIVKETWPVIELRIILCEALVSLWLLLVWVPLLLLLLMLMDVWIVALIRCRVKILVILLHYFVIEAHLFFLVLLLILHGLIVVTFIVTLISLVSKVFLELLAACRH